jgi:ammonium transporter, Amt family
MNQADTAFVLVSAALVMLMTPGLALFYGGMVRSKNVLNTIMENFIMLGLVGVIWALWGYSLAFGPDVGHFIGNLDWVGLAGVGAAPFKAYSDAIPHQTFMIYQAMFAIITPALITGAFVERLKFSAFMVFMVAWVTLVYCPVAHWVWGDGGWLKGLGALDFAGGTVVHINAGIAALAAALVVGPRKGYGGFGNGTEAFIPHNLPMTVLGAGLLWFGWFGFNAGSELAADGVAGSAFLVTNTSAAMGALSWMGAEWAITRKPTVLGLASGVVAGLVAITPAAGFVNMPASLVIGCLAGLLGYVSVSKLKNMLGYDDSLDAFGVHGLCGIWGALATGIFANPAVTEGARGLFYGNPGQLWVQFLSIIGTAAFSAVGTLAVAYLTKLITGGLRVEQEDEIAGLDNAQHGERAFEIQNV